VIQNYFGGEKEVFSGGRGIWFWQCRVWTQDLALAGQGLHQLSKAPSPFWWGYFSNRILVIFHCLLIYSYVHTLSGPSLPAAPHHSLSPTSLASRQNLFCPLLQFCWREDIRNYKKDSAFASLR
jgi:hypothetical protein